MYHQNGNGHTEQGGGAVGTGKEMLQLTLPVSCVSFMNSIPFPFFLTPKVHVSAMCPG